VTARRCFDPTDPTDPAPAAARTVDQAGTRSADQQISIGLCALLVGHSDTASRRARSHKFMPPAVDQDQAGTDTDWYTGGPYITNVRALRTELNKLLFTAGGSHAGGAAADLDLATYSLTARRQNQDNYLFRWSSIGSPSAYHYLRSRVPRG
jgi:hypothetical protein